ncbi:hypothetical protein A6E05_17400 [Aliivibrio sp. 1S165]|uniref:DUF2931 family protein n=1 Tax=unclassified Aliivibrio TaxID=2645654 RepID=UPI00080E6DF9|nr:MULTISPECIES: DUF2931 family protein [unclassified Aliivibrio]OCH16024.1 hypothetical protein A6E05_17400 [Aliivibrio sp. 1S165]OCH26935.1 hypothetical protein A6E06_09955 [Aliivibrio sp. 1S175]
MNKYLLITLCLLVSSCSIKSQQLNEWRVSTIAPKYYIVRVDTVLIFGEKKKIGWKGMVGKTTVSSSDPLGWAGGERYNSGYSIKSIELPGSLYVRWHSLANKKTYHQGIKVSEDIRNKMREYHNIRCGYYNLLLPYKNNILLGLAPDGMISVFLNGGCFDNELQFKVQAVEDKVVDDFVYPELSEEAQAYVDEHGVPVGIW